MSHTDIAMAGSLNFVELCWEYSRVMKLLGVFNSFKLKQGGDECAQLYAKLFSFLKFDINWVSYFLQQKVGKP